jgi:hypothetical protein
VRVKGVEKITASAPKSAALLRRCRWSVLTLEEELSLNSAILRKEASGCWLKIATSRTAREGNVSEVRRSTCTCEQPVCVTAMTRQQDRSMDVLVIT